MDSDDGDISMDELFPFLYSNCASSSCPCDGFLFIPIINLRISAYLHIYRKVFLYRLSFSFSLRMINILL